MWLTSIFGASFSEKIELSNSKRTNFFGRPGQTLWL